MATGSTRITAGEEDGWVEVAGPGDFGAVTLFVEASGGAQLHMGTAAPTDANAVGMPLFESNPAHPYMTIALDALTGLWVKGRNASIIVLGEAA